MLKERDFYADAYTSMPTTKTTYFGRRRRPVLGRNTTLDLAYQYVTNKRTQYHLFFSRRKRRRHREWAVYSTDSLNRHYLARRSDSVSDAAVSSI